MRLIDADAIHWQHGRDGDVCVYPDTIAEMPTIEERKTGKWMSVSNETQTWHHCSECHYQQYEKTKFCPSCGADMRGESDEL